MSNGSDIADEVALGLIEAAEATGNGQLICSLIKGGVGQTPWDTFKDADERYEVNAVQTTRRERDGLSDVKRITRVLLIGAKGPVVEKGDRIAVGVTLAQVTESTRFNRIGEVQVTNTGGIPLLYKADMVD